MAPVFSRDNVVDYYVPAGRWTNHLTGAVIAGPRWVRETHDFLSVPLLVRPNIVLPVGSRDDRPDYPFADNVTLEVYELDEGANVSVHVPALDGGQGATFQVRREGSRIRAEASGTNTPWRLLLVGTSADNARVAGSATTEASERGLLVTPAPSAATLRIDF